MKTFLNSKFKLILAVMLLSSTLTACNTMKGVGQDIESVGGSIENSASKNKNY